MTAHFSIGIDLGTTSSALAYAPLIGETRAEVLPIPQWETADSQLESSTLPSFLYLPEGALARALSDQDPVSNAWIIGGLARRRASETPGRVVRSAKSW